MTATRTFAARATIGADASISPARKRLLVDTMLETGWVVI